MRFLWFYIVCWHHRKDDFFTLAETYALILKAARRCNYDLGHAIGQMKDESTKELFRDSYYRNKKIFSPDGGKNYRHELHHAIWDLESEVRRLKKQLIEAGLDPTDPDAIPF